MKTKDIQRLIIGLILFSFVAGKSFSQQRYWVFLKDKKGVEFDPISYFDKKAIERRQRLHLPVFTESDCPLNSDYVRMIEKTAGKIISQSRWLNAVTVNIPQNKLEAVAKLDFVSGIKPVELEENPAFCQKGESELSELKMELLVKQTKRMGGDIFEKNGIDGKGVRIAIFDGGFPGVDISPVFEHLRREGRIIKTWDFVRNREFVYGSITHGTMVLSCIAGIYKNERMGLATGAEFLLARTEQKGEPFSEEENWMAAVEWADKNGADIINSSLGYTYRRYFPNDMNGRTSLVAKAANIAASKGILVVNAMGNDGNKLWEFMGTPADADSVLSVGGIDPKTDFHISFSSYGPTSDMRRKPNVSAYAEVIAWKKDKPARVQGTSFSTPLVAGFAACVMQLNPGLTNMEIFHLVEQSGHLYPYYDYAHGYGIPQARYFFQHDDSLICDSIVQFRYSGDTIRVMVNENISLDTCFTDNLLYYHLENKNGVLEHYTVVQAYKHDVIDFLGDADINDKILRVNFKGCTIEHKF